MKISQIASKPQLVKITIDDEDTVTAFGEAVDFWTWDRQPLEKFMKLAAVRQDNPIELIEVVRTLILDEDGKEVIGEENMLPSNILIKAIGKIVEILGK